jgi:hypothetical protein
MAGNHNDRRDVPAFGPFSRPTSSGFFILGNCQTYFRFRIITIIFFFFIHHCPQFRRLFSSASIFNFLLAFHRKNHTLSLTIKQSQADCRSAEHSALVHVLTLVQTDRQTHTHTQVPGIPFSNPSAAQQT